jgi:hypothetical protein
LALKPHQINRRRFFCGDPDGKSLPREQKK